MAFCEVSKSDSVKEEDILNFCKDKLAKYKMPRRFEFVLELPRNPMGKVLKTELRKPFWVGQERNV
jgi:long-chain acyl-CoA synthetase